MKPNPGGIITGSAIVDRADTIQDIWNTIENQSIVFTSERRVGKTSVLRKIYENPQNGWIPILYFVEGKKTPIEFAEGLYDELLDKQILSQSGVRKLTEGIVKIYGSIAGQEVIKWKLPRLNKNWKRVLDRIFEGIQQTDKRVLIMIDELPHMLYTFLQDDEKNKTQNAMELLDYLRELRNRYEGDRKIMFIFCGSIGLHLVLNILQRKFAYNSSPVNNMSLKILSGMDKNGVAELCEKLSEGEPYAYENQSNIYDYIAEKTDGLPFYIQHVYRVFLQHKIINVDCKEVDKAVEFLINESDKGCFQHYVDRIINYYDTHDKVQALAILDIVSQYNDFVQEAEIFARLQSSEYPETKDDDKESFRKTLNLLMTDNYLVMGENPRKYKFRYTLIHQWWRKRRG